VSSDHLPLAATAAAKFEAHLMPLMSGKEQYEGAAKALVQVRPLEMIG
jgi:hypothetical protein